MRIEADRELCIGAGMCALTAPELFGQDDEDGRVLLLRTAPWREDLEAAQQAVELCPSGALSIRDDAYGPRR
jgi:ferredoxin